MVGADSIQSGCQRAKGERVSREAWEQLRTDGCGRNECRAGPKYSTSLNRGMDL